MTEDEAREKKCPQIGIESGTCIASDCMAWRDGGPQTEEVLKDDSDKEWPIYAPPKPWRYIVSYDDGKNRFRRTLSDAPRTGYCGLGGAP